MSQRLYLMHVVWFFAAIVFSASYAYAESIVSGDHPISPVIDDIRIIVVAACVVLTQVGLLFRAAGAGRPSNAFLVAKANLLGFVLAVVAFALVGVTLAFGRSQMFPFGTGPGLSLFDDVVSGQAAMILFHLMLGGVAITIFSGAIAERMAPRAMVLGCLFMAGLAYPVFLHWVRGDMLFPNLTAFLASLDFVDLAGGISVHATAGWIVLAAFMVIGSRFEVHGRKIILSTAGALLLFAGWVGLNGGFAMAYGASVPAVIANSLLAGGMGACIGYLIGLRKRRQAAPEHLIVGMLGGVAAVTSGAGLLDVRGALIMGAAGGAVAIGGNLFVARILKVNDPRGAVGIYAFAGSAGAVLLPLVAPLVHLPAESRLEQIIVQIVGVGINFYWAFGASYLFFRLLDRLMVIRREDDAADGRDEVIAEWSRQYDDAERVAALAKATFEAIMIHRDGVVVDGNEELAKLVGRPLPDLIGRSIFDFLRDGQAIGVSEIIQLNDDARHEISIQLPDGTLVPVAARGRDITFHGEKARVGCFVDLTERKEAEKHIRYLALHDPLTGLPNRVLFTESLNEIMAHPGNGPAFGIAMIDLDRFKDINDIHGHQAGDAVISEVSARLMAAAGPRDIVARLGGDEFAAIFGGEPTLEDLEAFGARLLAAMAVPIDIRRDEPVNVTLSIGAALFPDHAADKDALVGCADIALHYAKTSGRNAFRLFRRGMNDLIEKRRMLETDLELALHQGQFELYLQPRVCANDVSISGYEALLRWSHPVRGMVSPADFIPVAEASGKIIQLGEWVLAEAVRLLDHVDGHISVNVSPLQFRHGDFIANLADLLHKTGADPRRIELEITESVLIDDDKRAVHILDELKRMGFTIALDDFGTGYSSLSYLSRYPFDTLKIDRSFVANLGVDDKARMIVRTIIDLGTGLGMNVVAEGVETPEEARFLTQAGCHELQGYLLGRPAKVSGMIRNVDPTIVAQLRYARVNGPGNHGREFERDENTRLVG